MSVFSSVCVTGASRGLGLEFVMQLLNLANPPKHVFALCRDPEKATALMSLVKAHPSSLHVLKLDVTNTSAYDGVVSDVKKVVGSEGLGLLINNAGVYNTDVQSLDCMTKDDMMRHFEVNIVSPVLLTKAFMPLLKQAGVRPLQAGASTSAAVVFLSTKYGTFSPNIPANNPYRYSKAALNMAVHCLAKELEPQGVLATVLHPGWVKTDMGGPDAEQNKDESVRGCLNIILNLKENHRGKLYQFDGTELEW